MSKILEVVSTNYSGKRNQEEDLKQIRVIHQNTKDIIDLPLDNEDEQGNKKRNLTDDYYPHKVF